MQVLLVLLHVRQGEHADERADDGDDQHHHGRKLVHVERGHVGGVVHPEEFEDQQPEHLQDAEYLDEQVVVFEAVEQDHAEQGEIQH